MNRTRLLMIGALALALGVFVSLFVYKNLQGRVPSNSEPGVDVVVAADDIQVGARVEDHDVRIVKYPRFRAARRDLQQESQVLGRGVILPISKGEFILPSKLAPENAGSGLPSLIPPGMRAVSVRVNEVVSVAGFVGPGTRVDMLLTGTPNGSSEAQTTTVLQNVAVIASGHTLERNAAGEAQNTPVITLLVSPEDAERLTLASSEGTNSTFPAQPPRYSTGRSRRSQCQGTVQRRHTGRGSAAWFTPSRRQQKAAGTGSPSFGPECRGLSG